MGKAAILDEAMRVTGLRLSGAIPDFFGARSLMRIRDFCSWGGKITFSAHVYEVRPRKDKRGVDLISDVLPFGRLWYGEPNAISNAIGYAKHRSRSHDAVIRVYNESGNVIETHEHAGDFKEWWGRNMPRKFSDKEIAEFIDEHLAHRLTALLCFAKRSKQSDFWQGRGDVYCASLEGSFIMFRVFVEFLGLESYRLDSGEHDLRHRARRRRKDTDVMLDNFDLALAEPSDFGSHRHLIARVHDGVSKATAHLTYEANDFFDPARDYLLALHELVRVIHDRLYKALGKDFELHPDLKRL